MIKTEHELIPKRRILAFAFEASTDKDLETLDLLYSAFQSRENLEVGYITSKRIVLHVKDMPAELFKTESEDA